MRLFRSEEHLDVWIANGNPCGESMSIGQQWDLARLWFCGRHLPSWKKRSPDEAEALFNSLGLISDFWSLE